MKQGVDTKLLLTHIKSALQNSSAAVRLASIQLISTLYMYAGGAAFRSLFDQEKPALLEQLDAEIEKIKTQRPAAPTRGLYVPKAGGSSGGGGDGASAGGDDDADDPVAAQLKQEALLPRVDIGEHLSDTLMDQLNDKNWKERQAALEKLETLLRDHKFIEPSLNELPTHLNKRMCDTNKILATTTLRISERLAVALGSQGRRHVAALAPGMIQALSDNKDTLRKAAVSALTSWFDHCGGLGPFVENELLVEAMQTATNPKSEHQGRVVRLARPSPAQVQGGQSARRAQGHHSQRVHVHRRPQSGGEDARSRAPRTPHDARGHQRHVARDAEGQARLGRCHPAPTREGQSRPGRQSSTTTTSCSSSSSSSCFT
jgi:hypothetical protein